MKVVVGPGIKFATVMEEPETDEVRPLELVADQEIEKIVLLGTVVGKLIRATYVEPAVEVIVFVPVEPPLWEADIDPHVELSVTDTFVAFVTTAEIRQLDPALQLGSNKIWLLITGAPPDTDTDAVAVASANARSAALESVTWQVPTETAVSVAPLTVQIVGVVEVNVLAPVPDPPEELRITELPTVRLVGAEMEIGL